MWHPAHRVASAMSVRPMRRWAVPAVEAFVPDRKVVPGQAVPGVQGDE
jgi:hypothetical protein